MILQQVPKLNETPEERAKRLDCSRAIGHPTYLKEGKRVYTDTTGPGFKQGWLSWLLAVSTLTLVSSWLHILLALLLFSWVPWVRSIIAVLVVSVFLPARMWNGFKYSAILSSWRQYFNYSVIVEHVLRQEDDRGHLFACFPHGVLAFTWMAAAGTDRYFFPDREMRGIAGSSVFYIPLFRHISGWLGGLPATRSNISRMLERGRFVVTMTVGGMAEMFLTSNRKVEQIYLKKRKGFVRLAVAGGHTIVPMYYFGNSQMLTLWSPKIFGSISRKLGLSIGFVYGRLGLPIPRPVECMAVSGTPISCGPPMSRDDPKFDERVEELHERFMTAIKKLFDDYKGEYGWPKKELVIL